jgi:hypothetical protein
VLAATGGIAYASIPDSSGVIHGCYKTTGGGLRVIDTDRGATCTTGEKSLNWNQTGPQGATGPRGPSDAYFARMIDEQTIPSFPGRTLLSLDIPVGDYAVMAKVVLADSQTERIAVRCHVDSGDTELDSGELFLPTGPNVGVGISLLATASGPTTLNVRCWSDSQDASAINHGTAILATQVGTIHQQ